MLSQDVLIILPQFRLGFASYRQTIILKAINEFKKRKTPLHTNPSNGRV
jgi:hypothetical protein